MYTPRKDVHKHPDTRACDYKERGVNFLPEVMVWAFRCTCGGAHGGTVFDTAKGDKKVKKESCPLSGSVG